MLQAVLLLSLPVSLLSLTCVSCPLKLDAPHSLACNETCQGDICYIVVNNFFNGTVIAGCLSASQDDLVHNGTSVCHRKDSHVLCACTSGDKCNDPHASLSKFDFTDEEILEGQQIFPQIQPTESPAQSVGKEQSGTIPMQRALQDKKNGSLDDAKSATTSNLKLSTTTAPNSKKSNGSTSVPERTNSTTPAGNSTTQVPDSASLSIHPCLGVLVACYLSFHV